ncbi:hypothetical protein D3C75_599840 [compost metagenome]
MHEEHGDNHITLLRQLHDTPVKIMSQIAVRKGQEADIIEQQVARVIDAAAQLLNLLLGVVGEQFFAVDAFFHQISNQRIQLAVRLIRVSFVAAVDGSFFVQGGQQGTRSGELPVRLLFRNQFKCAHREGIADLFSADLFTAQLGLHTAQQGFFA